MAFLTLYLQLLGMDNFRASLLVSMGMLAHAAGGQLGGFIGDYAAGRAPKWGRIFICQLSVIAGDHLTAHLHPNDYMPQRSLNLYDCMTGHGVQLRA